MLLDLLRLNEIGDGMDVGKSLAESIEGATTAYYRDGGGTETGIAADERLVEALKQAYIAAYARNDGGSLDTVRNELAEFGGREPTTDEICEAAIALAGKQAKQDVGVIPACSSCRPHRLLRSTRPRSSGPSMRSARRRPIAVLR